MGIFYLGFTASLLAGLATGAGALPIYLGKQFSDDTMDVMLGFSAGVMLAATAFSLLVPSISLGGPFIAVLGFIIGAVVIHFIDQIIPHFHPVAGPEGPPSNLSKIWLFIIDDEMVQSLSSSTKWCRKAIEKDLGGKPPSG